MAVKCWQFHTLNQTLLELGRLLGAFRTLDWVIIEKELDNLNQGLLKKFAKC